MSKISSLLLSRLVITGLMIFVQAAFIILMLLKLSDLFIYVYIFFMILSIIMAIYIISRNNSPSFKIPWIVLILVVPLLGGVLYILLGQQHITTKNKKRWSELYQKSSPLTKTTERTLQQLQEEDSVVAAQAFYLERHANSPLYQHTTSTYYPVGDDVFPAMLKDLENAKEFIFIEYFIIQEGVFWNSILEVLKKKVKEQVEVRVMYDDLGSIALLPSNYYKTLESYGIKCIPFNRFIPILSIFHNNRDHRKIMVIDGKIGYTGGLNLADEYINKKERFGHWKDTCIRLEGEAVKSLTVLFLESWDYYRNEDSNFSKFLPDLSKHKGDGFVQPYGDSPLDKESVGKEVYMNMINQAQKYLYINTPYLIVDYDMIESICRAAKRGVDIRMMLPFHEDKWYVHIVTRSFYDTLIEAGVKILEYKPGFIHAKSFVLDDKVAVIGTINLDYRSLVHHFECGVWLAHASTVLKMKEDFLTTEAQSIEIKLHEANNIPWYLKIVRDVIKFFSPLM